MKNKAMLLMLAASLGMVGCSNSEGESTPEVKEVTYSLDQENSTLNWHGEENEEHFHEGTISFTSGSLTMKGDELVSAEFELDPATINPMTEGYPQEKMDYLKSHLMDTSFFFTAEHPMIKVTANDYTDGKLSATINVRGLDVTADVPVTIEQTEDGASITGDFSIDFADAKIPYITEPDPETGKPGAKSTFDFKMKLNLKK